MARGPHDTSGNFGLSWNPGVAQETSYRDVGTATQTKFDPNSGQKTSGGLLGGFASMFAAKRAEKIARENREWQERQNTIAYERSLPWSSFGPAGNVEFDPETREMLQTLKPDYQALMQGFIGSSAMATQELQSIMGDPNKMAKSQFDLLQELSADDYARSRMQGEEVALARGMLGTESYYDKMATEDAINQSILRDKISSVGLGMDYRKMVGQEALGNLEGATHITGQLRSDADLARMIGQGSHTGKNIQGIREGGQDYADTQSAFYSGMLDQKAKYNQQGKVIEEAEPGWLSQLISGGKEFFSLLT